MTNKNHVFLSYNPETRDVVEQVAAQLQNDARLSFWFAPWHSVPGQPIQEQMEQALGDAGSCAIFIDSSENIQGWQNEQMRVAIQTRVEDYPEYRVIPVLLPGVTRSQLQSLPRFLRRYEPIVFQNLEDSVAMSYLTAGILGIRPADVKNYLSQTIETITQLPSSRTFNNGHALIIGVAGYPHVRHLPQTIIFDAQDMRSLLLNPNGCAYHPDNITMLLDEDASASAIRNALDQLSKRVTPDDTVLIFFSGHGANIINNSVPQQYLLPYECHPDKIAETTISSIEVTNMLNKIHAGRLLVLFDACHSGGIGDPKSLDNPLVKLGLTDDYYSELTQAHGRVVIASCRNDEQSWVFPDLRNSVFTHYVLDALRGQAKTLGDGYIRVFDIFRHVAQHVPKLSSQKGVNQHPIFKAHALDNDFPIACKGA